ncbi:glycine N-acyltransferase isoform 1-T1 [Rhynchonycteris naso]
MTLITTPTLTKSTPRTPRTVRNCLVHQKSSTGNSICRSKAKIPAQMLHLQGSQMLQMLEKSLRKGLPESLKVYGTVFHMNQGNPFKLKALVDKWPDFTTVVVCPQEQEMVDDSDHYTNTYQIYSKDPENCQELLGAPEVINWKQHLQIQSSQSSLNERIQHLAATKSFQVEQTQCFLYMSFDTVKKLIPSLLDVRNLPPGDGKPKAINQEMFKLSSLDVTHAALVNKFWSFGGNEKSQRFIERCIQNFPTFCLLGPEGTPVSWSLMDQTGELRMAATMPEYRRHSLVSHLLRAQIQALEKFNFPMYSHVDRANHAMRKVCFKLSFVPMPVDWNQWKCEPL